MSKLERINKQTLKGLRNIINDMGMRLRMKLGNPEISFTDLNLKVNDITLFCDFMLLDDNVRNSKIAKTYYENPSKAIKVFGMPIKEVKMLAAPEERGMLRLIISKGREKIERLVMAGDCIVKEEKK